jgi:ParB family chromosome partitioning protein
MAFRTEFERTGEARWATIPAFVRATAGLAAALAAMVEENEVRAAVSPWGRGRIAVAARDAGAFPTVEAAVDGLYPHAAGAKRTRLRALARLAEGLDGAFAAPERLSERQALRLARAVQGGHGAALRAVLAGAGAAGEWRAVLPVLAAAERPAAVEAEARWPEAWNEEPIAPARRSGGQRPGPARIVVRRESLRDGWALRVTGPDATAALMDAAMAKVEAIFRE